MEECEPLKDPGGDDGRKRAHAVESAPQDEGKMVKSGSFHTPHAFVDDGSESSMHEDQLHSSRHSATSLADSAATIGTAFGTRVRRRVNAAYNEDSDSDEPTPGQMSEGARRALRRRRLLAQDFREVQEKQSETGKEQEKQSETDKEQTVSIHVSAAVKIQAFVRAALTRQRISYMIAALIDQLQAQLEEQGDDTDRHGELDESTPDIVQEHTNFSDDVSIDQPVEVSDSDTELNEPSGFENSTSIFNESLGSLSSFDGNSLLQEYLQSEYAPRDQSNRPVNDNMENDESLPGSGDLDILSSLTPKACFPATEHTLMGEGKQAARSNLTPSRTQESKVCVGLVKEKRHNLDSAHPRNLVSTPRASPNPPMSMKRDVSNSSPAVPFNQLNPPVGSPEGRSILDRINIYRANQGLEARPESSHRKSLAVASSSPVNELKSNFEPRRAAGTSQSAMVESPKRRASRGILQIVSLFGGAERPPNTPFTDTNEGSEGTVNLDYTARMYVLHSSATTIQALARGYLRRKKDFEATINVVKWLRQQKALLGFGEDIEGLTPEETERAMEAISKEFVDSEVEMASLGDSCSASSDTDEPRMTLKERQLVFLGKTKAEIFPRLVSSSTQHTSAARLIALQMKMNQAATTIQALVRGVLVRGVDYHDVLHTTDLLEYYKILGASQRMEYEKRIFDPNTSAEAKKALASRCLEMYNAATKIQALARGYLCRKFDLAAMMRVIEFLRVHRQIQSESEVNDEVPVPEVADLETAWAFIQGNADEPDNSNEVEESRVSVRELLHTWDWLRARSAVKAGYGDEMNSVVTPKQMMEPGGGLTNNMHSVISHTEPQKNDLSTFKTWMDNNGLSKVSKNLSRTLGVSINLTEDKSSNLANRSLRPSVGNSVMDATSSLQGVPTKLKRTINEASGVESLSTQGNQSVAVMGTVVTQGRSISTNPFITADKSGVVAVTQQADSGAPMKGRGYTSVDIPTSTPYSPEEEVHSSSGGGEGVSSASDPTISVRSNIKDSNSVHDVSLLKSGPTVKELREELSGTLNEADEMAKSHEPDNEKVNFSPILSGDTNEKKPKLAFEDSLHFRDVNSLEKVKNAEFARTKPLKQENFDELLDLWNWLESNEFDMSRFKSFKRTNTTHLLANTHHLKESPGKLGRENGVIGDLTAIEQRHGMGGKSSPSPGKLDRGIGMNLRGSHHGGAENIPRPVTELEYAAQRRNKTFDQTKLSSISRVGENRQVDFTRGGALNKRNLVEDVNVGKLHHTENREETQDTKVLGVTRSHVQFLDGDRFRAQNHSTGQSGDRTEFTSDDVMQDVHERGTDSHQMHSRDTKASRTGGHRLEYIDEDLSEVYKKVQGQISTDCQNKAAAGITYIDEDLSGAYKLTRTPGRVEVSENPRTGIGGNGIQYIDEDLSGVYKHCDHPGELGEQEHGNSRVESNDIEYIDEDLSNVYKRHEPRSIDGGVSETYRHAVGGIEFSIETISKAEKQRQEFGEGTGGGHTGLNFEDLPGVHKETSSNKPTMKEMVKYWTVTNIYSSAAPSAPTDNLKAGQEEQKTDSKADQMIHKLEAQRRARSASWLNDPSKNSMFSTLKWLDAQGVDLDNAHVTDTQEAVSIETDPCRSPTTGTVDNDVAKGDMESTLRWLERNGFGNPNKSRVLNSATENLTEKSELDLENVVRTKKGTPASSELAGALRCLQEQYQVLALNESSEPSVGASTGSKSASMAAWLSSPSAHGKASKGENSGALYDSNILHSLSWLQKHGFNLDQPANEKGSSTATDSGDRPSMDAMIEVLTTLDGGADISPTNSPSVPPNTDKRKATKQDMEIAMKWLSAHGVGLREKSSLGRSVSPEPVPAGTPKVPTVRLNEESSQLRSLSSDTKKPLSAAEMSSALSWLSKKGIRVDKSIKAANKRPPPSMRTDTPSAIEAEAVLADVKISTLDNSRGPTPSMSEMEQAVKFLKLKESRTTPHAARPPSVETTEKALSFLKKTSKPPPKTDNKPEPDLPHNWAVALSFLGKSAKSMSKPGGDGADATEPAPVGTGMERKKTPRMGAKERGETASNGDDDGSNRPVDSSHASYNTKKKGPSRKGLMKPTKAEMDKALQYLHKKDKGSKRRNKKVVSPPTNVEILESKEKSEIAGIASSRKSSQSDNPEPKSSHRADDTTTGYPEKELSIFDLPTPPEHEKAQGAGFAPKSEELVVTSTSKMSHGKGGDVVADTSRQKSGLPDPVKLVGDAQTDSIAPPRGGSPVVRRPENDDDPREIAVRKNQTSGMYRDTVSGVKPPVVEKTQEHSRNESPDPAVPSSDATRKKTGGKPATPEANASWSNPTANLASDSLTGTLHGTSPQGDQAAIETPGKVDINIRNALQWLKNKDDTSLPDAAYFKKLDKILPRRASQSDESKAKEMAKALNWVKKQGLLEPRTQRQSVSPDNGVDSEPQHSPLSKRKVAQDYKNALTWLTSTEKSGIEDSHYIKKLDAMLPKKVGQKMEERASEIAKAMEWARKKFPESEAGESGGGKKSKGSRVKKGRERDRTERQTSENTANTPTVPKNFPTVKDIAKQAKVREREKAVTGSQVGSIGSSLPAFKDSDTQKAYLWLKGGRVVDGTGSWSFKKLDGMIPKKHGQTIEDRASEISKAMKFLRKKGVMGEEPQEETKSTPESDFENALCYVKTQLSGGDTTALQDFVHFKKLDNMLPKKKNELPEDRAKAMVKLLGWLRKKGKV